jgi:protein-tyrosine phosphatase
MFHNIIVICTGNICRSPIAEALLKTSLTHNGCNIQSAGIAALVHHPADPSALEVAQEHGYDLSLHRARQATLPLLTAMDLILTLDQTHNEWIRTRYPQLQGRTFKLGHWRNNADIADPYRKPRQAFDQAFSAIRQCSEDWVKRIAQG